MVGVGRRFGHCSCFRRKPRTGKLEREKFKGNKSDIDFGKSSGIDSAEILVVDEKPFCLRGI